MKFIQWFLAQSLLYQSNLLYKADVQIKKDNSHVYYPDLRVQHVDPHSNLCQ